MTGIDFIPYQVFFYAMHIEGSKELDALITWALQEDIGAGDVTSAYFVSEEAHSNALVVAREPLVLAGGALAEMICEKVDSDLSVRLLKEDGDLVQTGEAVLEISGKSQSILTAERTVLNFMQRLSGVATLTHRFVEVMGDTKTRLLDTRKTTPGWRALEKYAVLCGGGENHRMGLYDRVMVKDNHIAALGGIPQLQECIDYFARKHPEIPIEVEVDTLDQLAELLTVEGVRYVLLDNMSLDELKQAVSMVKDAGSTLLTEASGGVNLSTIGDIATTGVDYISVGAVTHSATAVDLGMDF